MPPEPSWTHSPHPFCRHPTMRTAGTASRTDSLLWAAHVAGTDTEPARSVRGNRPTNPAFLARTAPRGRLHTAPPVAKGRTGRQSRSLRDMKQALGVGAVQEGLSGGDLYTRPGGIAAPLCPGTD